MKIWILTGDKKETAINIGYATNIIGNKDKILFLDLGDSEDISVQLEKAEAEAALGSSNLCLLITGDFLLKINTNDLRFRYSASLDSFLD